MHTATSQRFDSHNARWDRRDDYVPADEVLDGDIGEDERGIWISIDTHPQQLLLEEPLLWDAVSRFRHGDQEPYRDDFEELSAFELACKTCLRVASTRHLTRKPGGSDG